MYGKELILDLHDCDPKWFTKKYIEEYIVKLCLSIGMERALDPITGKPMLYFWELHGDEAEHLIGTSATQFIRTSTITIHALDKLRKMFINIFSCKDFEEDRVVLMSILTFSGKVKNRTVVVRD